MGKHQRPAFKAHGGKTSGGHAEKALSKGYRTPREAAVAAKEEKKAKDAEKKAKLQGVAQAAAAALKAPTPRAAAGSGRRRGGGVAAPQPQPPLQPQPQPQPSQDSDMDDVAPSVEPTMEAAGVQTADTNMKGTRAETGPDEEHTTHVLQQLYSRPSYLMRY